MSERKSLLRVIKAAIETFSAALELTAAEIRTGVRLVEAAAIDEYELELRMIANTEENRAQLRALAIEAGKLGLSRPEELGPMIRAHHLAKYRLLKLDAQVKRYLDEFDTQ